MRFKLKSWPGAIVALLASGGIAWAVNTALSNLSASGAIADANLFYVVQSAGVGGVKATAAQVKTYTSTSAVRATTTTSEALATTDQGKLVTFSNSSSVAATIAQAGAGTFFSGWVTSLRNLGAGTVTLTPSTSTVDGAATVVLLPGQGLDLYSDGTNYFTQSGRGTIVAATTIALATGAIASATCTAVQSVTATGLLSTDAAIASFNGDPTAVTGYIPATAGMLTIIIFPSTNNFNVRTCNNTSSSVTPGAITLNLKGVR